MEAGRLGVVHKQEVKHRKFVCVMNDLARSQQDLMDGYISRDKHEASFRFTKDASVLRKAIVRQRVLQKCLKMRRDGNETTKPMKYGAYGGIPLEYLSRDIDAYIERMHPRIRRMKKVQQLMQNSLDRGAILAPSKIVEKIDEFFSGTHRIDEKLYRDVDELEREREKRRRERQQTKNLEKITLPPVKRPKPISVSGGESKLPVNRDMKVNVLKVEDEKKLKDNDTQQTAKTDRLDISKLKPEKVPSRKSKSPVVATKIEKKTIEKKSPKEVIEPKPPKSMNLESVVEDDEEENSRGSLILPPLRMTKALVQRS